MTNDLKRRVEGHDSGKAYATRLRSPFSVIYYEAHSNKYDAAQREQFLKTGWGKGWIKRTLSHYFRSKS